MARSFDSPRSPDSNPDPIDAENAFMDASFDPAEVRALAADAAGVVMGEIQWDRDNGVVTPETQVGLDAGDLLPVSAHAGGNLVPNSQMSDRALVIDDLFTVAHDLDKAHGIFDGSGLGAPKITGYELTRDVNELQRTDIDADTLYDLMGDGGDGLTQAEMSFEDSRQDVLGILVDLHAAKVDRPEMPPLKIDIGPTHDNPYQTGPADRLDPPQL